MVLRVARRVRAARRIDDVWVATDDGRIAAITKADGLKTVMTEPEISTGTERVSRALQVEDHVAPALVVNVQGDEPLIDPADLDQLVAAAHERPDAISTLAREPTSADDLSDPHLVKVDVTAEGRATAFSRRPLARAMLHVGVYAYPPSVLWRFVEAAPTIPEREARLEQLRAFGLGIPIFVTMCQANGPSIGVDVPADVGRVEAALRATACDRGLT